jgi:hypothetical protein
MTKSNKIMVLILSAANLWAQAKLPLPTLDVYNNNMAYVHQWYSFNLSKNLDTIQIANLPRDINPASIQLEFSKPTSEVKILEQKFQTPAPLATLWQNSLGKKVTIYLKTSEPITGTLLQYDGGNVVVQPELPAQKIIFVPLADLAYVWFEQSLQPKLTTPLVSWLIESKSKGSLPAQLSYQVSGLSWNVEYTLVLQADEKSFSWTGYVNLINHSDLQFEQALLRLIAGNINQPRYRGQPTGTERTYQVMAVAKSAESADFEEQAVVDYHVYPLNRPIALSRQESKQIPLFDKIDATGEKIYLFANSVTNEREGNLQTTFRFANAKRNNLGMPLPAGNVRLFSEAQPAELFIGQDVLKHTAENDTIVLTIGEAFDVKGKHLVKERTSPKPRVELLTVEIELTNQKKTPLKVRVEEQMFGDWYIKSASHQYIRLSNQSLLFPIQLASQQKETITFTVQRTW